MKLKIETESNLCWNFEHQSKQNSINFHFTISNLLEERPKIDTETFPWKCTPATKNQLRMFQTCAQKKDKNRTFIEGINPSTHGHKKKTREGNPMHKMGRRRNIEKYREAHFSVLAKKTNE